MSAESAARTASALFESLDTRLGLFHCADGHAPVVHGEGPFGCPACESAVELRKFRCDVVDLNDDVAALRDEVAEVEGELRRVRASRDVDV